jgi:hypothetical protein
MFGFRRIPIGKRTRLKAMRGLYIRYYDENKPEARGLRLLQAWLSPLQLDQFNAKSHFDVVGCVTGRRYRIHYGTSMNVHELDSADRPKIGWCFVPKGRLVPGDVMLAQKIALETFESRALSVAINFEPKWKTCHGRPILPGFTPAGGRGSFAIGHLFSVLARDRGTAAGVCIGLWLLLALLIYDMALLALCL